MVIIDIIGVGIGIAGIVLTIYYQRRASRIEKLSKTLDWSDIQTAAVDLARKIVKVGKPVAILTPNLAGATFVNLLVDHIGGQPPVFVGIRTWKDDPHPDVIPESYLGFVTSKCINFIPKDITEFRDGMILFVDDFVMSGDFLEAVVSRLVGAGIPKENIYTASIVATTVAVKNHKAPHFFWWEAEDDEFYFPWGKAR